MNRVTWDKYFLNIAEEVASRSTCDRLKVGCVLVKENKVIGTGYNGSVKGQSHCNEVGHLLNEEGRCIRTVHAEINALLNAQQDLTGATVYVTHEPCEVCTKTLAQAGVWRIVFRHSYPSKYNKHFKNMLLFEKEA